MKKPSSGSKRNSNQHQSAPSDQTQIPPKWRPVFGEKYPPGFKPPTLETDKPTSNKSPNFNKPTNSNNPTNHNKPKAKSTPQQKGVPQKKLKPKDWADYFARMDPTERILFAFTAYRQPKDLSIDQFYNYDKDSFRYLDTDLLGPDYSEVVRMLSKWKNLGLLIVGRYSNLLSLEEGVAEAFWQFIEQQGLLELYKVEPEQSYPAEFPNTLDNIFNFLVMIEQGEVLITRTHEINKHSLKRVLAALTVPPRPDNLFSSESYFFWLLRVVRVFQLFRTKGERLDLTTAGRELPEGIKVEDLLGQICPIHVGSITNKGFFVVFPLIARCTEWTSLGHMVTTLISTKNLCNLLLQDHVIYLLEPLRLLGLLDWGKLKEDIFVRATPLGQFLIPKLLRRQNLEDYKAEIKKLTDSVYPMNGPNTAYVQPNFEILLPHSASWTARWELSQFAVLEQQDQMLKYRLDKTFLMNALKRGLPANEVLSVLTKLSTYPLPENLVLTVQQWVESFGQVAFVQLSLLECTTPEQAASIASARKYREYVLGLYSPTAVIVREVEKLRKLLEKQGIFPLPGVLSGEGVAERKRSSDED
ncbi:hypothetical protein JCM17380_34450 [Desulfosporosinus burensis]